MRTTLRDCIRLGRYHLGRARAYLRLARVTARAGGERYLVLADMAQVVSSRRLARDYARKAARLAP